MKKLIHYGLVVIMLASLTCCKSADDNFITIALLPVAPNDSVSLRWSPKGEKLPLTETENGLETKLYLGPEDLAPIPIILGKEEGQEHYHILKGDWNRNGEITLDEVLTTSATERRGKFWSSFTGSVDVIFKDKASGESLTNPYPLAFWYVFDPLEPEVDPVLRFSRRGWMKGQFETDSLSGSLLLTEMKMDGLFDIDDSWAMSTPDNPKDLYLSPNARSCTDHNWMGEQAFRIVTIDPTGREAVIALYDPGMTRKEEIAARDHMAVDRNASRSGKIVNFLHDYDEAKAIANSESKSLLIDFETTWCGPCKQMDQWVYTADTVVNLSTSIVAVKIDGDESRDLVKKFEVSAYPTMILMSSEGEEIRRVTGYQSVKKMAEFITQ